MIMWPISIDNVMYGEIYEKTGSDIIREIKLRYSSYRKRMDYTQKDVADKSCLSIFTISSFENGSSTDSDFFCFIYKNAPCN